MRSFSSRVSCRERAQGIARYRSGTCTRTAPARTACRSVATDSSHSVSLWSGSDDFSALGDRVDAPPLPLPAVRGPARVVLVRHGQSTWNAEGRIQGSTDLSVLTAKGVKQAERTRDMLSHMRFDAVIQSPLARARQTADTIMQGQAGGVAPGGGEAGPGLQRATLPALREVDLYSFQGLLKHEGKALYGEAYARWQRAPHEFELDGHAPVRELWHRASMAWRSVLAEAEQCRQAQAGGAAAGPASPRAPQLLVVAHNAINQALVATALGLPPRYFRLLPQNNAALSILDFSPPAAGQGAPRVKLVSLNQSPDNPFKNPDKVVGHVAVITPADSGEQLERLAAVFDTIQVTHVLHGCPEHAAAAAALVQKQAAACGTQPEVLALSASEASCPAAAWARAIALAGLPQPPPPIACAGSAAPEDPPAKMRFGSVVVVAGTQEHAGLLLAALGLATSAGPEAPQFGIAPGGLSVAEFTADPRVTPATIRCINNTAHLA